MRITPFFLLPALVLLGGCDANPEQGPQGVLGTSSTIQTEVLSPDGNPFWGDWWGFVDSNDDGTVCGSGDCCGFPCADSWKAVDEPLEDAFLHADYMGGCMNGHTHRFTFTDLVGPGNLHATKIVVTFGKVDFDPLISQALNVLVYIDGAFMDSESISCFEGEPCDTGSTVQSVTFDGLFLTKSQINGMEIEISATGGVDPDHWIEVYQMQAAVTYTIPGSNCRGCEFSE